MAPNNKLEEIVQVALPYDQPVYKLGAKEELSSVYHQASSSHQELSDEHGEQNHLRITTRARVTYELDRFSKNEMLVIKNSNADPKMMTYLLKAFEEYKFEFTVIDAEQTDEQIWQTIDQFFQKDFSTVGVTAVVTLRDPFGSTSSVNRAQEWDLLDYFVNNQPPSLQGRPKIFINEVAEPSNPPQNIPSDTLLIQTKKVNREDFEAGPRPLDLLCYKLISMNGRNNILDILSELTREASREYPAYTTPVACLSTMSKELLLERGANDSEDGNELTSSTGFLITRVTFSKLLCILVSEEKTL